MDPGVTTGYCFAELENVNHSTDVKLTTWPKQYVDDVDELWDRIEAFGPRYIVCEDFEYRNRSRAGLVLFSVQAIGVARLYSLKTPQQCDITLQKAAQGKGYYTNTLLKKLGVYKPGENWEHSMDATRHLLHWLTFSSGYQLIEGQNMADIIKLGI